jgi:hypothetical protein
VKGWGQHAFIYAASKSGERFRYDVQAFADDYKESWRHPFKRYDGQVFVSKRAPQGPMIFVAKLSVRGKMIWDRLVVGREDVFGPFSAEFRYNFYVANCYTWTAKAAATAMVVSLLPL